MENVGILVVSYGARAVAMVDAFARSLKYDVKIFVADKQKNPFNLKRSAKHKVIPDLNIEDICKFSESNKDKIDFGIVGPENPIIDGVRDLIERQTSIPIICPTKECAIEVSKVAQRRLFQEIIPEVNPRFRIFDPKDCNEKSRIKKDVYRWLDELENKAVVKPDKPATGKGVGVWGDHFTTREELLEHFLANFEHGPVIIEEKIEGEESSFQALCDGKHLLPLPETRDYKRAFDDDEGPNTGGMGSYKDIGDTLPFMTKADREKEIQIIDRILEKWKPTDRTALRGMPFYVAFIHTGKGPKILENNSRPGDPEIQNILPLLKDDFVDVCFKILEGNLTDLRLEKEASVVTYKVPPRYGGYMDVYPDRVNTEEIGMPVDLEDAYGLAKKYGEKIRVYPAAMELRDSKTYALRSRSVSVVGIDEDIQSARQISLEGLRKIKGGGLWHRRDIASEEHIQRSIVHMENLRRHEK